MEGLKFGWRLSFNFFHFYDKNDLTSLCGKGIFHHTRRNSKPFLTEIEIEEPGKMCNVCYVRRRQQIGDKIKQHVKGQWQNTVCPKCKTKVTFWDSGTKDEHVCTVCRRMVIIK